MSGLDLDSLFASATYKDGEFESVDEAMAEEEEVWDEKNVLWWIAVVIEPLICLLLVFVSVYLCFVVKQKKKMDVAVRQINEGMAQKEKKSTAANVVEVKE